MYQQLNTFLKSQILFMPNLRLGDITMVAASTNSFMESIGAETFTPRMGANEPPHMDNSPIIEIRVPNDCRVDDVRKAMTQLQANLESLPFMALYVVSEGLVHVRHDPDFTAKVTTPPEAATPRDEPKQPDGRGWYARNREQIHFYAAVTAGTILLAGAVYTLGKTAIGFAKKD